MKQERLDFLASNKKFTKRLALSIGSLCRTMPIKEVAKRMNLDWHTVKELEKEGSSGFCVGRFWLIA